MKSIGRILAFVATLAPLVSMGDENDLVFNGICSSPGGSTPGVANNGDRFFFVPEWFGATCCGCDNKSVVSVSIPQSIAFNYILLDDYDYNEGTEMNVNLMVTRIQANVFNGCSLLQSISIPDSVASIGYCAFYGCSSLQSVSMSNVTSIEGRVFENCSSLQSVSMPNVTSIGYQAFYGCSSLQSISIPSGVKSIEDYTFYGCTSLESVTIGDSVGSIGTYAFYQCSSLAEVTIPASVTNIALDAFMSCDGLQRFIVDSANPVYASYDGALYTKDLKTLIIYPGGRTDVKLPSGALAAKEDAFTGCEKLWAEWYRTFQKTRYDLTNGMEDRAIASVTVNADTYLGSFVLKEGKVYDSVIYINNVSGSQVKVSLPEGNIYKTFKGAAPLTLPGHSTSILTVTRVAGGSGDNVFLVTREELEDVK